MSAKELVEITGADYALLGRILRSLAAINALDEVDVEKYVPTKISRAFATEKGGDVCTCKPTQSITAIYLIVFVGP